MKQITQLFRIIAVLSVVIFYGSGFIYPHAQVKATNHPAIELRVLPDLAVSGLKLDAECHIVFTLENRGTAGVPEKAYNRQQIGKLMPCKIMVRYKGTSRTFLLARVDPFKRLSRGRGSVVFRTPLRLTTAARVKVVADAGGTVRELRETNNQCASALTPQCSAAATQQIQQNIPGAAATQIQGPTLQYTDFTVIHAAHEIEANGKGCWQTLLMNPTSEGYSIHFEIHERIEGAWQLARPDSSWQLRRNGTTPAKHLWDRDPRSDRVRLTYKRHNGPVKAVVEKPLPAITLVANALTVVKRFDNLFNWRTELVNSNSFTLHNVILVPTIMINTTWQSAGNEQRIDTLSPGPHSFTHIWDADGAIRCRVDIYTQKNPDSPRHHIAHREVTMEDALNSGPALPPDCFHVSRPTIEPYGCRLRWKVTIANYSGQYVSNLQVAGRQRIAGEWKPLGASQIDPMPPSNVVTRRMVFYPKPGADVIKVYVTSLGEIVGASEVTSLEPIHHSGTISNVQLVPSATTTSWSARIHNTSDLGLCKVRVKIAVLNQYNHWDIIEFGPTIDLIGQNAYKDVNGQFSPGGAPRIRISVHYIPPDNISPETTLADWVGDL